MVMHIKEGYNVFDEVNNEIYKDDFPDSAAVIPSLHHCQFDSGLFGDFEEKVMIVKIVEHKKNFTISCNEIPQNHGLSLEARGLMSEALSLPKDWELHKQYFVTEKNSLFQINKIFKELKEAGHARIKNIFEYDQQGSSRIKDRKWVIYEDKRDNEDFQKEQEKQNNLHKKIENSLNLSNPLIKGLPQLRDSLNCGITLNEVIDPPLQRTNNILQSNNTKKEYKEHTSDLDVEEFIIPKTKVIEDDYYLEGIGKFNEAWSFYPNRVGTNSKKAAFGQWCARLKEKARWEDMLAGVIAYQKYCRASGDIDTRFVLMASTFLGRNEHYTENWEEKANGARTNKPGTRSVMEINEEFRKDHHMGKYAKAV